MTDTARHAEKRRHPIRRRILLALVGLLLVLTPSATAFADPSCTGADTSNCNADFNSSVFLPSSRFSSSTAVLHDQFTGGWVSSAQEAMTRGIEQGALTIANGAWGFTQSVYQWVAGFDPLKTTIGQTIDQAVHTVGEAIASGPQGAVILVLLILIAIVIAFRTAHRTGDFGFAARRFVSVAILTGLFWVMITAAGGGQMVNGSYQAQAFSPVWVGQMADDAVNNVAGGLSNALTSSVGNATISDAASDQGNSGSADGGNLSCTNYMNALSLRLATTNASQLGDKNATSSMAAISQMYVSSAVAAYEIAQFGDDPEGRYVWCRGADYNGSMSGLFSPTQVANNTYVGWTGDANMPSGAVVPGSAPLTKTGASPSVPFGDGINNDTNWQLDTAAFGICHPWIDGKTVKFAIPAGFAGDTKSGDNVTTQDCQAWWSAATDSSTPVANAFSNGGTNKALQNIATYSPSDVASNIPNSDPTAGMFINSLSGADPNTNVVGSMSTGAAAVGSVTDMIVLGGLSLGAIAARLMVLLFAFAILVAVIKGMFAQKMFHHIGESLKALLGVAIFAAGFSILLATVTIFTAIFDMIASGLGGAGTPAVLGVSAFAPILAVLAIHFLARRLGLPSPVTISGGKAWASMMSKEGAALAGGAVAGGLMAGARNLGQRARSGIRGGLGRSGAKGRSNAGAGTGPGSGTGRQSAAQIAQKKLLQNRARQAQQQRSNARSAWRNHLKSTNSGLGAQLGGAVAGSRLGRGVRQAGQFAQHKAQAFKHTARKSGINAARNIGSAVRQSGIPRVARNAAKSVGAMGMSIKTGFENNAAVKNVKAFGSTVAMGSSYLAGRAANSRVVHHARRASAATRRGIGQASALSRRGGRAVAAHQARKHAFIQNHVANQQNASTGAGSAQPHP